jgi:hypothetical protein
LSLPFFTIFLPLLFSLLTFRQPAQFVLLLLFSVEGFTFCVIGSRAEGTGHSAQFGLFSGRQSVRV